MSYTQVITLCSATDRGLLYYKRSSACNWRSQESYIMPPRRKLYKFRNLFILHYLIPG